MMKFKTLFTLLIAALMAIMPINEKVAYSVTDMGAEGYSSTISSGPGYSMFIKADGSLWGCGDNYKGALGDSTTDDRRNPIKIMDDVTSVSASYYFTMVIKNDGSLWGWGNNEEGQLGDGTTLDRIEPIKIMENVRTVSTSAFYNVSVKKDGSLWAWGANFNGELGDGTKISKLKPVKIMDNVMSATVGKEFGGMAIKEDGSLWGWGSCFDGYLGLGMESREILRPIQLMNNVKVISTGYDHTMVIKEDGSLWAWGSNENGKIGDGTQGSYELGDGLGYTWYVLYPKKIMDNVVAVSSGVGHTMAIKNDGSLWAWGNNLNNYGSGSIGDGTNITKYSPVKILDNVVTISAGGTHSMAIKKDGSLWSWGNNQQGELCDGTITVFDEWQLHILENNNKNVPIKVMEGMMLPTAAKLAQELALPTSSKVMVNGEMVSFDAYLIKDYTYFKLRDLAMALTSTEKQFEVSWNNNKQSINLTSDKAYTSVGGEFMPADKSNQKAIPTTTEIYINDKKVEFIAFEINNNNYFKLRDLGSAFDFGIKWDSKTNIINIDTSEAYTAE